MKSQKNEIIFKIENYMKGEATKMIPPREYHENQKQKPYIINIEDNQVFSADYVFQMMSCLRERIDRMWRKVLLLAGIHLLVIVVGLTAIFLIC